MGGGDQEGRPCMYMAAMLHPVYMILLRHFFFLVKFELYKMHSLKSEKSFGIVK